MKMARRKSKGRVYRGCEGQRRRARYMGCVIRWTTCMGHAVGKGRPLVGIKVIKPGNISDLDG